MSEASVRAELAPQPAGGTFRRWVLYGIAAFAGGELLFALISGYLDQFGEVTTIAGHIPTLIALGALIHLAQRRALGIESNRTGIVGILLVGLATLVAYVGGFLTAGPPMDFLLSIVVLGVASGIGLWLSLRGTVRRAGWCVAAVGAGYALGAAAGVGAAIAFGGRVDHIFGGGVTGFMGVVGMLGLIAGVVGSLASGVGISRILSPRTEVAGSVNVSTAS